MEEIGPTRRISCSARSEQSLGLACMESMASRVVASSDSTGRGRRGVALMVEEKQVPRGKPPPPAHTGRKGRQRG